MNNDLFLLVGSIAYKLIYYQHKRLSFHNINQIITFVNSCITKIPYIEDKGDLTARKLANLLVSISSSDNYAYLASLLSTLILDSHYKPISSPYELSEEYISLFCADDLVENYQKSYIKVNSIVIEVKNINIPKNSLLQLKAISFNTEDLSNAISITVSSTRAMQNGTKINEPTLIYLQRGDIFIGFPVVDKDVKCVMFNNLEWVEDGCVLIEIDNGKAIISIFKNGLFTMKKNSRDDSRNISKVALIVIISLITFALILVPVFEYLDKKELEKMHSRKDYIPTDANGEERKVPKLDEIELKKRGKILVFHLLLSLFNYQIVFARSYRVILIATNISLLIFFSNLILLNSSIHPILVGVIVGVLIIPCPILVSYLFIKDRLKLKILGTCLMFAMCMTTIIGSIFLDTSSVLGGCMFGLVIEFFLTEMLIVWINS